MNTFNNSPATRLRALRCKVVVRSRHARSWTRHARSWTRHVHAATPHGTFASCARNDAEEANHLSVDPDRSRMLSGSAMASCLGGDTNGQSSARICMHLQFPLIFASRTLIVQSWTTPWTTDLHSPLCLWLAHVQCVNAMTRLVACCQHAHDLRYLLRKTLRSQFKGSLAILTWTKR